jgi:uncharacterized protein
VLRVVVDPGVLVSAALSPRAAPAALLRAWREGAVELVVSPWLLQELDDTLRREKFRRYLSEEDAGAYVGQLHRNAVIRSDPDVPTGATPDPGDDYLVGLARAANADFLVSGDRHLTELSDPDPPVLTPRAFVEHLHTDRRSQPADE